MHTTCSDSWALQKWPSWILTACFSSRVLDAGRCVLNCPSWKFEFKKQCLLCHHTCEGCRGSGPSNCTSCRAGEGNCFCLHFKLSLFSQKPAFGLTQKPAIRLQFRAASRSLQHQCNLKAESLPGHKNLVHIISHVDSLPLRRCEKWKEVFSGKQNERVLSVLSSMTCTVKPSFVVVDLKS